jgi:hypothetical protein
LDDTNYGIDDLKNQLNLVNLSNESAGTFHIPFSTTRQFPEFPANFRNRSFHIVRSVTSILLHASAEIIDKKSFADYRFLVSVAIDNLSVLSVFISIFCPVSMISIYIFDSFEIIDGQYFSNHQVLA